MSAIKEAMTAQDIRTAIDRLTGVYGCISVPEFTWRDQRIDVIHIDPSKKRIRGFEIKVSRSDFKGDDKWQRYSRFCSSLSVACPKGLIQPSEIEAPFGLLWVEKNIVIRDWNKKECVTYLTEWAKKPKDFQGTKSMAWTWTYLEVLEMEFKRLAHDERRNRP